jgi:hypothetical protein
MRGQEEAEAQQDAGRHGDAFDAETFLQFTATDEESARPRLNRPNENATWLTGSSSLAESELLNKLHV